MITLTKEKKLKEYVVKQIRETINARIIPNDSALRMSSKEYFLEK